MHFDQAQHIEQVRKALGLLQLLVLKKNVSTEELESRFEAIQRQVSALSTENQQIRDHHDKVVAHAKGEIQALRGDLERAERQAANARAISEQAVQETRKQRYHRQIIEEENQGLIHQIKLYTNPNVMLDAVDDVQLCPNCGEQQMDRAADDSCLCRFCMSRFLVDFPEPHPL